MITKYRLFLASLALILGLAVAVPALAATNGASGMNGYFHRGGPGPGIMGNGVFGQVTAISGDTLTLTQKGFPNKTNTTPTSTTYTVDATNATVTKNGTASTLASIAVGDTVMVQGTVNGTQVTATKINDGFMMRSNPGVFGTVTAISGNTITITSKMGGRNGSTAISSTYTVDASNASVTKAGASSTVSAIAVGDMISVQGTVSGTTVTATKITDGIMKPQSANPLVTGNGEPVIAGTISAISGDTLTVTNKSNITYTVDASNAKVTKGNATSSVSALAVNDNVVIQGTVNGTQVTAASVIDQGQTSTKPAGGKSSGMGGIFSSIGNFFKKIFGF